MVFKSTDINNQYKIVGVDNGNALIHRDHLEYGSEVHMDWLDPFTNIITFTQDYGLDWMVYF